MPGSVEATKIRFTVDGKSYDLEISDEKLPLRERIEFEDYMGMPWVRANAGGWMFSEKGSAFLAYLAVRRRRKTVTLDEILDSKKLEIEINPDESPKRPTKASGKKTPASTGSPS